MGRNGNRAGEDDGIDDLFNAQTGFCIAISLGAAILNPAEQAVDITGGCSRIKDREYMRSAIGGNLHAGEDGHFAETARRVAGIGLRFHQRIGFLELVNPGTAVMVCGGHAVDLCGHVPEQPFLRRNLVRRAYRVLPCRGVHGRRRVGVEIELPPAGTRIGPSYFTLRSDSAHLELSPNKSKMGNDSEVSFLAWRPRGANNSLCATSPKA